VSGSTSWNPESYAKNARFVADLGEPLLQLLGPQPGELICDLGCGDGVLTEKIAAAGARVIGVDTSRAFLATASARGLSVVLMDGEQFAFKSRFDAVFTNAALHWMRRAELVLQGVARSVKHGGRFVGEFGGAGNVASIRAALHDGLRARAIDPCSVDPWYFPAREEYAALLDRSGFLVEYIELVPRPTGLSGDITDWLELFAQPFLKSVTERDRPGFVEELRDALAPTLRTPDGTWWADYVRLRFKCLRLAP
jgi:trans-aconitate methyltransferase